MFIPVENAIQPLTHDFCVWDVLDTNAFGYHSNALYMRKMMIRWALERK